MALTGFESASDLVASIASRRLSAEDVLETMIERIERHNTAVNAVVARNDGRARMRARDVQAAVDRNRAPGPLAGLPFTVKDSIEVAGLPTTSGSLKLMGHRPERTSPAIARLIAAGGVMAGKTNLPEFAGDYQTFNKVFGITRNPWHPDHTPGGSSGGSAAAVAAGLTPLDIGSDLFGSLRIPAHFTGVFAHKPSFGVVPTRGHVPPMPGQDMRADLNVLGPVARDAQDLALALRAMAGPDEPDARALSLRLPPARAHSLHRLRVAYAFEDEDLPLDPEVLELLDDCVHALARHGVGRLSHASPDFAFRDVRDAGEVLSQSIIGASLPLGLYRRFDDVARGPAFSRPAQIRRKMARNMTASHRQWLNADSFRADVRRQCELFFQDHDVLLLPVAPTAAPLRDEMHSLARRRIHVRGRTYPGTSLGDWCALASMAYLPATVAPIGRTKAGLPVGVQIVGPYLEDYTTIEAARVIAEVAGGYERPPGFS